MMDETDRRIVNALQGGFPVSERPFAEAAAPLGLSEAELIARVDRLVATGILSRFGPLYNAERLGGAVTLAAMEVPEDDFERVADLVNAHGEVAHNYARAHRLNMWFVVAADRPERIAEVLAEIEAETGIAVLDMPKREEYFIGLRLVA
jgi:siroheme decarboxylase